MAQYTTLSEWHLAMPSRQRMSLPPISLSVTSPRSDYPLVQTPTMPMMYAHGSHPMMSPSSGRGPMFMPPTNCSPTTTKKRTRLIPNATKSITLELLRPHFDRPLAEVAGMFGICMTLMKKICRKNGVPRWPHRQIRGLRKSIWSIEKALRTAESEAQRQSYVEHLERQKDKLAAILRGPDGPGKSLFHELVMAAPCSPTSDLATPRASAAVTPVGESKSIKSPPAFTPSPRMDKEQPTCASPTITRLPSIATLLAARAHEVQRAQDPSHLYYY
ncbi:hypothetical protein Poli38472_010446 [Pythium oligandrum]|uniref:RWP-RK domain-containing protein n=1 Tax=Pythium oligandrum TaxID=41045 RepID=A0A8K1C362_PYTOL|nr:hypothetical protein Poli38472_010446 [Pythium oligandrum]|eukprot:TMW55564.1 hypothetical protein Poli38472_010446 [Pythium oligandrum]